MHRTTLLVPILVAPLMCGGTGIPERGPLRLSLKRAVELAVSPEGSTRIQLAEEEVRQAKARSAQARSALLPDVEASAGAENIVRSLSALGLNKVQLPFNVKIPSAVGPYNVVDIRATVGQNVWDFSSIRRLQSAHAGVRAAQAARGNADAMVSATVGKAYVAALRAKANQEAVRANVALAEAVLQQSRNQKSAGAGTGIEITRAQVQLSNERQRELVMRNERRRTELQLLRAMGLRLDTELELTDSLEYNPVEPMTFEAAKAEALKSRPDLKAQQERETAARLSASAVKYERLPSLAVFADYGTIGPGPGIALLPTRMYGFALRVPVFDGGRRDARRAESSSVYRQERIRSSDLSEQIELDLRLALDSLHSAEEQVNVAKEGLSLSENELAQARRRYEAGITTSLEVTDAQTRLERARDNEIAALFNYNVARIDLGQAMGNVGRMIN